MIDLETMSTESTGALVSIGATLFDPEAGTVDDSRRFYTNVDLQSCIKAGLVVDGSTVMWWLLQSDAARKHLTTPKSTSLTQALLNLSGWIKTITVDKRDVIVWGNGAIFDPVLLDNAYKAVSQKTPWFHYNVRDTRTVVDMYGDGRYKDIKAALIRNLSLDPAFELHNALSDAVLQAHYISIMWKNMQDALNPNAKAGKG